MQSFVIEGGKKLYGSVKIDSAKNSLLPLISAIAAIGEKCTLQNVPRYSDVEVLLSIIAEMGGTVKRYGDVVEIDSSSLSTAVFPKEAFEKVRASVFMLGGILARFGYAVCPMPGGCKIGERPVNFHLDCLKQMGAEIRTKGEIFFCRADKLKGTELTLPFPSVGVTENITIAACFAAGETVINNCAIEPEVIDLVRFLNECGADVKIKGRVIRIVGKKRLKGITYKPVKDRIEAGTFVFATLLNGGEVEICSPLEKNIYSFLRKMGNNACKIDTFNDKIYIKAKGTPVKAVSLQAKPYPGFPTDMQPQAVALLSVANGCSYVNDSVFSHRFAYVGELNKLGANIAIRESGAVIRGVKKLHSAHVVAEDLRGGASLMLACLKAEGTSVLEGVEHVDRGYFRLDEKLRLLGANVKRI